MTRRRPQFHFAPGSGWMNDPHGLVFDGARHHLFYQYVPGSTDWKSDLSWGHAVSDDLVHWAEVAPAIDPVDGEVGCWSGSVVMHEGSAWMFYTRPTHDEWGRGQVVLVHGDATLTTWERRGVVIDGPPSDAFFDFRDPQVRRAGDGWKMTIGAGQRDVGGCALQYSSHDLEHWTFDGVLASRPSTADDPFLTGTVWECPQFLQVDGHWVLMVSAMDKDQANLAEVLYAIGDYDGTHFAPRTWGRFGHARTVYATTTFTAPDGRACAMSWVRDLPRDADQPWAGEQSLVHELHIINDRLVVTQLAELDAIVAVEDPAWRCTVDVEDASAGGFCIDVDEDELGWSLVLDWTARTLHVSAQDHVTYVADLLVAERSGSVDVVVDAGIAEVTWSGGEGVYVFAVPDLDPARIDVTTWD